MAAPSVANSTVIAVSATGIQTPVTSAEWYSTIVVANNTANPIYVAVDGGILSAAPANHELEVVAGQELTFDNEQPLPNPDVGASQTVLYNNGYVGPGVLVGRGATTGVGLNGSGVNGAGTYDQSEAVNWTAQTGYNNTGAYPSGFPTYVSIWVVTSMTGTIVVTLQ